MPEDMRLSEQEQATIKELLVKSGSQDYDESFVAMKELAAAVTTPLREGIITGDIVSDIFEEERFDVNSRVEYPIDFYRNDNADDFNAYVIPQQGEIPYKQIHGDKVTVPTYMTANSIDWLLRYARDARWPIVQRALQVLEAGFVKKDNDDGWHAILAAAVDRNILVYDTNAAGGQFTKRLVSLMKTVMRRNAGGNSASINRGRLTHIMLSPEALEDIRNWDIDEVDDITRREIFLAEDGSYNRVFGVTLVDLDEFGENQTYQTYYEDVLGGTLPSGDSEIVIGLDMSKRDSFVRPVVEQLQVFADPNLHRSQRAGFYAWKEAGFAVLNNSRVILGSL